MNKDIDIKLRKHMAEKGHEMTLEEVQEEKKALINKFRLIMPELDDMDTDEAFDFIASSIGDVI